MNCWCWDPLNRCFISLVRTKLIQFLFALELLGLKSCCWYLKIPCNCFFFNWKTAGNYHISDDADFGSWLIARWSGPFTINKNTQVGSVLFPNQVMKITGKFVIKWVWLLSFHKTMLFQIHCELASDIGWVLCVLLCIIFVSLLKCLHWLVQIVL